MFIVNIPLFSIYTLIWKISRKWKHLNYPTLCVRPVNDDILSRKYVTIYQEKERLLDIHSRKQVNYNIKQ